MFTRRQFLRRLPLLSTAAAAAVTGCRRESATLYNYELPENPLQVVTTTLQLAEMVNAIGGEAVSVISLIQRGLNPHLWKPVAADRASLRLADVAVLNGLGLEAGLLEEIEKLRQTGVFTVAAGDSLPAEQVIHSGGEGGAPDPHIWMDPTLWAQASLAVEQTLKDAFPPAAVWFADRAHVFRVEMEKTASWAGRAFQELPEDRRSLFTSHHTFAYFARAFGLDYHSLAPAAGPLPEAVSPALLEWLRERRVRTLFREPETDLLQLKDLCRPLDINPEPAVFSLSTAPEGRRMMSSYRELDVGLPSGALNYTMDIIQARLMLD